MKLQNDLGALLEQYVQVVAHERRAEDAVRNADDPSLASHQELILIRQVRIGLGERLIAARQPDSADQRAAWQASGLSSS